MASFGEIVLASSVDLDIDRIGDLFPCELVPADAGTCRILLGAANGEFCRKGEIGADVVGSEPEDRASFACFSLSQTELRDGDR